jgi:hypothetical protein
MIIHRRRRPNACFVSCSSCSCALLIFTAAELNVFTIDRPFDILLTTTSTETAVIETLSGDPRSACIKISHESITTTIDRTAQRACIEVCESERERHLFGGGSDVEDDPSPTSGSMGRSPAATDWISETIICSDGRGAPSQVQPGTTYLLLPFFTTGQSVRSQTVF